MMVEIVTNSIEEDHYYPDIGCDIVIIIRLYWGPVIQVKIANIL